MNMWAEFMVQIHAKKVAHVLASDAELKAKAQIMLDVFSVPFHLMSVLLQKIASDPLFNVASPKRKRWNFVWDSQLAMSIGADHEVAGVPLFFVSGDDELLEAAKAAKCDGRVVSLDNHLGSVGFS